MVQSDQIFAIQITVATYSSQKSLHFQFARLVQSFPRDSHGSAAEAGG